MINGLGRSLSTPNAELAVINVTPGKRYVAGIEALEPISSAICSYRFRLVSLSCDPNYVFSIDGHAMTVIEADGVNSQPLGVDSIQIFSSQRYSFIVSPHAWNQFCAVSSRAL